MTTYKFRHDGETFGPFTLADVARLAPRSRAATAAAKGDVLESTGKRDIEGEEIYEGDRVSVEVARHGGGERWISGTIVWTGVHWGILPDAGQGFVEHGRIGPLLNFRIALI